MTKKPNGYWTKEKCQEEALKYNIKKDFFTKSKSAYSSAVKKGWLDDICSHMISKNKPMYYWTFERCRKIALKCKNKKELKTNYGGVYHSSRKNGWYDDICKHMIQKIKPNYYWTEKRCGENALKYKTRRDFQKYSGGAYNSAKRNGWLDNICSHMIIKQKKNGYWNYEKCEKIVKNYNDKPSLRKNHGYVYDIIIKNKWFDLFSHMKEIKKPNNYWNYEKCKEIALKCNNITDFYKNYSTIYYLINKNKWFELISHFEKKENNNKRCIYAFEFSDNFVYIGLTDNINRRKNQHLREKNSQVYKHIKETNLQLELKQLTEYIDKDLASEKEGEYVEQYKNNGWNILNKVKTGTLGGNTLKWTFEKCKEIILKCNTKNGIKKKYPSVYGAIRRNGWKNELYELLEKNKYKNEYR